MFLNLGYVADDGQVWRIRVKNPGIQTWNLWVSPVGGEPRASVWKSRKEPGLRPRTAILRRFDDDEGRFVTTLAPVFRRVNYEALVIGAEYQWSGFTWELVGTRAEIVF